MIGALISKDKGNSAIDFINIVKYKVENLKKKFFKGMGIFNGNCKKKKKK